jgi:hypothetical protein
LSLGRVSVPRDGAGDAPGGVVALFDVDGEREEVDPFAQRRRGDRGHEHDGVAAADDDGAVRLPGEDAGLDSHGLRAEPPLHALRLAEDVTTRITKSYVGHRAHLPYGRAEGQLPRVKHRGSRCAARANRPLGSPAIC